MPKLQYLTICGCPLLEALSDGLGNLVTLQQLRLENCAKLEHLPSRDAMRGLTKLWYLKIKGCPKLEESCNNRSGPNTQWSNISHIPKVKVVGATVQVLLEKLISLTIEEVNSSRDFNKDLEMLTQNVSLIQAFIHDVETPQVEKQQSVEQWLNRLERVLKILKMCLIDRDMNLSKQK
ncbi:hypothetical protein H5410_053280 [Solanum commersonii]|uniref:Disease resistance N-terminal domain-containing protein n=1 Tax=Solanum commersonii TaxID=4109 RepID=A0A9J5X5I1_SOLCO|nr:hypothetical protein H5410_053280 [Solanum commersonii]